MYVCMYCTVRSDEVEDYYCLVKGSPEVIGSLLIAEDTPTWYSASYEAMARKGLRVLALAYKKGSSIGIILGYSGGIF